MELSVAQKLDLLINLQRIDSQIDGIMKVRGDLPEEVRELDDEIAGYNTRIGKFQGEIQAFKDEIAKYKLASKECEKLIAKYQEQQNNVRNNREFEAISKEIESQELDIQIFQKRIKETDFKIEQKNAEIALIQTTLEERQKDLANKNAELEVIIEESKEDEAKLLKERDKAVKDIEERLLFSYERLRKNANNGLGVVTVKRGACGGCFNMVPPQRQADIRERKKIIVCEHCGRILANVEVIPELEAVGKK